MSEIDPTPPLDETQRRLLPAPGWSPATEAFWSGAGAGRYLVQQCRGCDAHRYPVSEVCYACLSTEWEWSAVPGTGTVFSYTWADWPPPPDGERNITVVELDGTEGPDPVRVLGWVVEVGRDELECDLPVEVTFLPLDDEVSVPAWKPRRS